MTTPMTAPPRYRFATASDAPELARLRIAMQQEVKNVSDAQVPDNTLAQITDYFTQALQDGSYLGAVAECEGKIVSVNGLVFYRRPPGVTGGSGLMGYVTNVYTLPAWRKRGIARKLLDMLLHRAREFSPDKLHLGATEMGKGLYLDMGFSAADNVLELRLQA